VSRDAGGGGGFLTFSQHCLERYSAIVCTDNGRTDSLADDRLVLLILLRNSLFAK